MEKMDKKVNRYFLFFLAATLCVVGVFLVFELNKRPSKAEQYVAEETPLNYASRLLAMTNIDDFCLGNHRTGEFYYLPKDAELDSHRLLRSVSIYEPGEDKTTFMLKDSVVFDKSGKKIACLKPDKAEHAKGNVSSFYRTYYYYDQNGNQYLDVYVCSRNYDTTYTYRKFDVNNHLKQEIRYRMRDETYYMSERNICVFSDSILHLKLESFSSNYDFDKVIFPSIVINVTVKQLNDSIVQTRKIRTHYLDSMYNSKDSGSYVFRKNALIFKPDWPVQPVESDSACFRKRGSRCLVKRRIHYYDPEQKEVRNEFSVDSSILEKLDSMIDELPDLARENSRKWQQDLIRRKEILKTETDLKSIGMQEGPSVESFTPPLWYLASRDTGWIKGFSNVCVVAGYNTPLRTKEGLNLRCLAIYEKVKDKYVLRKQSFGALAEFSDSYDDLLYTTNEERMFSVSIEEGNVVVKYYYMRGEATYVFAHEKGKWLLEIYKSIHRTCCTEEIISYDYKTNKYTYSEYDNGAEDEDDPSITETRIEKRPRVYMDSMNIRAYDFNETFLFAR